MSEPGRLGVVGAGLFGRFCIESYEQSTDFQVVAVADSDPKALSRVASEGARLEQDWRTLIDDSSIEVLHVCTPPFLRGEIMVRAFANKKSVFCEKPLALTVDEADELIEGARLNKVALGVDYVMRHHMAYQLLELIAQSRTLGSLRAFSFLNFAQFVPPDHWLWDTRRGGGILVEHGVHFFDVYGRIAGSPIKVWGDVPRREAVNVGIEYGSGVVGHFQHEFAYPRAIERTLGVCMFEQGSVQIDGWIPTSLHGAAVSESLSVQKEFAALGIGLRHEENSSSFRIDYPDRTESYRRAIVAGMREVVAKHRDPRFKMTVTAEEARASLLIALEARSASEAHSVRAIGNFCD